MDIVEHLYQSPQAIAFIQRHRLLWRRFLIRFLFWGFGYSYQDAHFIWIRTPLLTIGLYWDTRLQNFARLKFTGIRINVPGYVQYDGGIHINLGRYRVLDA